MLSVRRFDRPFTGASLLIRLPTTFAALLASLTAIGTARAELVYSIAGPAVLVIDSASRATIASILVGDVPYRLAVTPDCAKVYVGQFHESTISVIGAARREVIASIPVGIGPRNLAITPDGSKLYSANDESGNVSIIDTAGDVAVATIAVASGYSNLALAISPDGARAYVASRQTNTVAVIDSTTNRLIATVPVGEAPGDVIVTPDGGKVFVSNFFSGTVSVISAASKAVEATIAVGPGPQDLLATPNGKLYVAVNDGDVAIIDTASDTMRGAIQSVRSLGFGIALSHDGRRLFVTGAVVCPGVSRSLAGLALCYLSSVMRGRSTDDATMIDTTDDTVIGVISPSDPDVLRAFAEKMSRQSQPNSNCR